jgi:predicted sulfurtransferase
MKNSSSSSSSPSDGKVGKKRLSIKERKVLKKQKKKQENEAEDIIQAKKKKPLEEDTKPAAIPKNEEKEEDYRESYKPIPVPTEPSNEVLSTKNNSNKDEDVDHEGGGRTLGKWFPSALLIKCSVNYTNTGQLLLNNGVNGDMKVDNPKSSLVLFYQYTTKKWSQLQLKLLMTYLSTIAKQRNIGGRVRVSQEGVNATISSVDLPGVSAQATLRHLAQDLRNFDPIFENTDFKYLDNLPPDRHFKEFKVMPVQELVFYGIKEENAPSDQTNTCSGVHHLDAPEYHKMLQKDNAVVIDVRNHYEAIIGRLDGQTKNPSEAKGKEGSSLTRSGAEYLDPLMRKSTDFKSWLSKDETKEKIKDKTVLMYCTGGIRCERASALLKKEMGDNVEGVYQVSNKKDNHNYVAYNRKEGRNLRTTIGNSLLLLLLRVNPLF